MVRTQNNIHSFKRFATEAAGTIFKWSNILVVVIIIHLTLQKHIPRTRKHENLTDFVDRLKDKIGWFEKVF